MFVKSEWPFSVVCFKYDVDQKHWHIWRRLKEDAEHMIKTNTSVLFHLFFFYMIINLNNNLNMYKISCEILETERTQVWYVDRFKNKPWNLNSCAYYITDSIALWLHDNTHGRFYRVNTRRNASCKIIDYAASPWGRLTEDRGDD